jgi:hypothetical protein
MMPFSPYVLTVGLALAGFGARWAVFLSHPYFTLAAISAPLLSRVLWSHIRGPECREALAILFRNASRDLRQDGLLEIWTGFALTL